MNNVRNFVPKPRSCGCKGIRSCDICEKTSTNDTELKQNTVGETFQYCLCCKKAWRVDSSTSLPYYRSGTDQEYATVDSYTYPSSCALKSFEDSEAKENTRDTQNHGSSKETHHNTEKTRHSQLRKYCHDKSASIKFDGILIIDDFVSQEEESFLDDAISKTIFVNSQSGRRKQDFGPKVNFKKQKLKTANFTGLPSYSCFLYERLQKYLCLKDFEPVELCNLEYDNNRGAHIDPHFDDSWLWGERLVTLNLLSDSVLTFTQDAHPHIKIRVPLLRRSLIVVFGKARYEWKHGIEREDIRGRRIAMTFRELSHEFKSGGVREKDGSQLLELALTFQGHAICR